MIEEKDLEYLGFVGFEHLSKDKRDGKRRLTWVGVLNDDLLTLLIVRIEDRWEIELLKVESDDVRRKFFSLNPTLDEVLQVIKDHGQLSCSD
ncbi:hypothetical protein GO495_12080 [Chitinophaga oryziterrae]|uniref:Uncharacterized protein n=1 Tax=Chitinophaga oryziterrae TaxID=1031224 RepID=A0A6N8J7S6_9BACT|nr:hypothetical protein [Chitinophaga oryziterrae]MVT41325.1 hypothetical protein [Chitinophaga oryziterrae]